VNHRRGEARRKRNKGEGENHRLHHRWKNNGGGHLMAGQKETEQEGGCGVLIGEKEAGWRSRRWHKRRDSAGAVMLQQAANGDLTQARHEAGTSEVAGGLARRQQYDFFISFKFSN
jgi:hypothetical protein